MKFTLLSLLLGGLIACGPKHEQAHPQAEDRVSDLKVLFDKNVARAAEIRDPDTGWLAVKDCDGMIWAGKYGSAIADDSVQILAAEYPDAPGKFARRPPPYCWTKDGGDNGSKTEWSRDMAVAGLFPWAWEKGHRDVLERHMAYGKAHNWQMGEPLADGRTVYTPQLASLLAKAIIGLGGEPDFNALWPDVWPAGLTDYEAHLQVMQIWLQGEIAQKLHDADAVPKNPDGQAQLLEISNSMYQRLEEHAGQDPQNPFYQFVLAKYRDGNQRKTLDLLLDPSMPLGGYVRCSEVEQCRLAEWLFVAHLVLSDFRALN